MLTFIFTLSTAFSPHILVHPKIYFTQSFILSTSIYPPCPDIPFPPSLILSCHQTASQQQTSTAKRSTTDKVSRAVCDWQLGKMALAAHRGMENPFSGCTKVSTWAHLSAQTQQHELSVPADLQSAEEWDRGGERLNARQISMKSNRWLSVNHFLFSV